MVHTLVVFMKWFWVVEKEIDVKVKWLWVIENDYVLGKKSLGDK